MLKIIHGNIFNTECDCIVNTVNCVGFMGKGIALEMSIRYPEMERIYKQMCARKEVKIGQLWMYEDDGSGKKILNFPTKDDYRYPSRAEFIRQGLDSFLAHYQEYHIRSIAFPMLGTTNGKIPTKESLSIMERYLGSLDDLNIEIYFNDRSTLTRDALFNRFIAYVDASTDPKKHKIAAIIKNDPKFLYFTDIVEAKILEEQPDGAYKKHSVATKNYLQKIIKDMEEQQKAAKMRPQSLFPW